MISQSVHVQEIAIVIVFLCTDVFLCCFSVSIAYSTSGATAPNRFVGIGSRDNNFLNIPQQTQVWLCVSVCVLKRGDACLFWLPLLVKLRKLINCVDVFQNMSYSLTPWNLLLGSLHLSAHIIPQSTTVCICTSVFYCTCVVYHVCSTVYLAHMEPPFRQQAFSLATIPFPLRTKPPCFYFTLILCPISHSFLLLIRFLLSLLFTFSPFSLLLSSAPWLVHMPPPLPPVLFSLVSNHTRLEPAQLCSSTHGNHLKLLCWSPPLFLCPSFSQFSLAFPPFLIPIASALVILHS